MLRFRKVGTDFFLKFSEGKGGGGGEHTSRPPLKGVLCIDISHTSVYYPKTVSPPPPLANPCKHTLLTAQTKTTGNILSGNVLLGHTQ